jgi:hypothetical protein
MKVQGVCSNTAYPNNLMASEACTRVHELAFPYRVIKYVIFLAGRRLAFKISSISVYRSQFTVATLGRIFKGKNALFTLQKTVTTIFLQLTAYSFQVFFLAISSGAIASIYSWN